MTVLSALVSTAHAQSWIIPEDTEHVWVRWSRAGPEPTRERVETERALFKSGVPDGTALFVENDGASSIYNVTLVVIPRGASVNLSFEETFAGDEPQGTYAYWPIIPVNGTRVVGLGVQAPAGEAGPFEMVAQVFFRTEAGELRFSRTILPGQLVAAGDQVPEQRLGTAAPGIAALVLASTLAVLGRRRSS